jgi:hypothetical protein
MGFFDFGKPKSEPAPPPRTESPILISQIDLSKRYDIYCTQGNEDRVYEDVRLVGIRSLEPPRDYMSGSFVELEAADGSRILISQYGIQMICEHGTQPKFRVLRCWGAPWES